MPVAQQDARTNEPRLIRPSSPMLEAAALARRAGAFTRVQWEIAMKPVPSMLLARHVNWFASMALGLMLVACGGGGGGDAGVLPQAGGTGTPQATTFTSTLTGEEEVPPVPTGAVGSGTLTFDAATLGVTGSINLDGMTATAAHVHIGDVGVNGPIVVPLTETAPGTWSVPSGSTLTQAQATALANGGLYFNAHSTAFPNGEIRGQIGRDVFNVQLTPRQEVPPPQSQASGTGRLVLDPATRKFTASIDVAGMEATAAHIHVGAPGVNGPIVFPLTETPAGSGIWVAAPDATLTEAQLAQLRAGELYFNAHSQAFPNGEIRGQIARTVGTAQLSEAEEVPPTSSTATGTGTLVINPATREASGGITTDGITATAAHVHLAAPGVNGAIIVPLASSSPDVWAVPPGTRLTAEQFAAFKQGNLYFNAHSQRFPNGEIRGQIR